MKKPWVILSWLILALFAGGALFYAILPSKLTVVDESSVDKTRQALRRQGFKTDLTNFDLSTSPDMRAREAAIKATSPSRNNPPFVVEPDLMEVATPHSAVVVWQSPLKVPDPQEVGKSDMISWDDFRQFAGAQQTQANAACQAILSGPISFNLDVRAGNYMLLPHLAVLRNLAFLLCGRTILALHDGDQAGAWTNLLAASRLVTAWQPEPAKVSHSTRFDNMHLIYDLTWQALQTNHWSDNELAQLQAEWESANFLTNLPEVQAFMGASDVKMFEHDELSSQRPRSRLSQMPPPSFNEFMNQALRDPFSLWQQMHFRWSQRAYFHGGMYDDERRLLLFYRDREVEYRNAIQASTWMQMRQMPGVTDEVIFQPNYPNWGLFANALNMRRMNTRFGGQGASFLARAAEAETERRIIVTALALERYREKNGAYPDSLQSLAPEFLQSVPVDFMNGQPLHYQVTNDSHFLLYSVGLDCVDNGGNLQTNASNVDLYYYGRREQPSPGYDIVWPYPASADQVAAARKKEIEAWADEIAKVEANGQAQQQRAEQEEEETRKAAMKKLLAEKPSLGQEPIYQGKPLSAWVIKAGQFEGFNRGSEDAVAAIRAIGPKAVPFLLEWMPRPGAEHPVDGAPGWDDVEVAWWALGSQGKSAVPTLAHLLSLPQKTMDDYSVWTESAKAISYLGPDAITPMLTVATNMEGQHVMWELLANFQNMGTNGAPAVPALVRWSNDSDYWVREGVVTALGGIGERPDLAVPVLTNILEHDSNGMVRRDAAGALGAYANDSDAVLPLLSRTLKDPDWQAREGALSGLGKMQDKPDVVIPLITPFLYDSNNVIQRSAAYALRDLGNPAGYRVLLNARNAPSSWPGIGDIIYQVQQEIQTTNWEQSPLREARVPGILAIKWSWDTNTAPAEEKMIEFFANTNVAGAGLRTMADLLTPKQVITGNEPQELTYEFPVNYDKITNSGFSLLLDADTNPESLYAPDSGAAIQDCLRATNGDTLLVWHTIFDPPGKHALQVEWTYVDPNSAESYGRGPAIAVTTSNFCQFSQDCVTYDIDRGATFHGRLPEKNGIYSIECVTTNGQHLKTLSGSTTNGEFNVLWNLADDNGNRLTGEWFNSIVHITLPDSGRTQTMRGP